MTIMLLPGDKVLVLAGSNRFSMSEASQIMKALQSFMDNPSDKASVMTDIKMVIDARCIPAIKFEVPK